MGSGRRMCRSQLLLLNLLVFFLLISLSDGSQLEVMAAPNLLRIGTKENIFVEIQDPVLKENVSVHISVLTYPAKAKKLASTTVTLTKDNYFQGFGNILIPAEHFSKDPNIKQYVYLQAQFNSRTLEKVVLVSLQSGYIFIQTDKTIYTPNTPVLYRIFAVTPSMEPMDKAYQPGTDASVVIEIMNPDGIILESKLVLIELGMYSGSYKLPEIVSTGQWKVMSKFDTESKQIFEAEFEVKEYVLPSFDVHLTSVVPFFHVDSNALTINIRATYLFGKEVTGTAFVVFGVITGDKKTGIPSSLQRVSIDEGTGTVTLQRQHIEETFANIHALEGSSIFVAVSVLTESGSDMVEAQLRGIQIVKSPYTITFKKTPKYFKPGMPFDVVVEVLNPDSTPANNIPVVLDPGNMQQVTTNNGMASFIINTVGNSDNLFITAKTNVDKISPEWQRSAEMTAIPHTTKTKNYIHISLESSLAQVGKYLQFTLNLNRQESFDITYLILSRGQMVKHKRFQADSHKRISLSVRITKDMLPSFRIIAYYHTHDEVVSDSVWVNVNDACKTELKLERAKDDSYKPGGKFDLRITGYPGASVGLVAVDKGVYILNNKHRISQKKIWDIVEKYDPGCTPGGGKDSMSVFYDAGLMFESSTASGTPHRTDLKCPTPSRRRRSTALIDHRTSLISNYNDKEKIECCLDGMKNIPVPYTCERRRDYVVGGPACAEAFLHCCKEMEKLHADRKDDALKLARSDWDEDDEYTESEKITIRTAFPESWLWSNVTLHCPEETPNCGTTSLEKHYTLKDSITTWHFTGISISRTHGICVSDDLEVSVRKEFFVDLRLPYSAVRGEQLEIKAIIHNYNEARVTVRIDLKEEDNLCSAAHKRKKYRQEVRVGGKSTRAVPFIIIPMKEGSFPIEVRASDGRGNSDGIRKNLRVVPPGVLMKSPMTVTLDPAKKGRDGKQVEIIKSAILETDMVPDTTTSTLIYLSGREQMSTLLENAISGKSMGNLIIQPYGCGEQNVARMTLPVIATIYLDKTNQWEFVGFEKRNEALQHIKKGYETELTFRKQDGSFAVFEKHDGNSWLTAYVAKVFAMAYSLVRVEKHVICDAIKFLILHAQLPDGTFRKFGYVYNRLIRSDLSRTDSDASMTAFCLIAMQESREICNSSLNSLSSSINKAVAYLENNLPSLTNPYAVSMASYALANENKLNQEILFKFISSDKTHWQVHNEYYYTLEATAYALLALIRAEAFEKATPIVRWLGEHQQGGGGYGSTQATIMAYQAIAEYWINAKEPEYNVNVDILLPGRAVIEQYSFNKGNHFTTRTSKFPAINIDILVNATGNGEAVLKIVSMYYALPKAVEKACALFNLSVQIDPVKLDENEKTYKLTIEVLFKEDRNASMSIVDVGLPTGFTFDKNDLDALTNSHSKIIARYESNTDLSERGSVIIYLDKVSSVQPEIIAFRIHSAMEVSILQPAAVSVYEYNNKKPCVKFYHPEKKSAELLRLCREQQECICAEENCSFQRKNGFSNDDRIAKACEVASDGSIDYVYKVRVENLEDHWSTDFYTVQIVEVIKEGTTDIGSEGHLRKFLSSQHCRKAQNLIVGKTYLIMGTFKDIYKDKKNKIFQYVLGERTWIEYWPTPAECQTGEYRSTCLGIEELVSVYRIHGCPRK
ncbi:complement C3-like [Archocentrus centrarchus]|uniref:complement C3-like n=1 Tax=Archocentrus centrarchus TaxID=63155 RepID=UPI0011E9D4A5|nr:complement C3-like [Archocentrus centrarchus]